VATSSQRILIVGATSGIATHCARRWAAGGAVEFELVGRDFAALERTAADLRVRGAQVGTRCHALDAAAFADPRAIADLVAAVVAAGAIDIALVAHGALPDQAACQQDLGQAREAMVVNALSPALFAEAIALHLAGAGRGTLALLGSVAGDRGRRSNYVYGAAKGLVARYAEGLQHRFAGTAVRVVCVKPGPTATAMTAPLAARGVRLAPVEDVAAAIVAGIARGSRNVYAPARWRWVMLVLRHLPGFVFNRMDI
jgi:short-subunit dehydrogenase